MLFTRVVTSHNYNIMEFQNEFWTKHKKKEILVDISELTESSDSMTNFINFIRTHDFRYYSFLAHNSGRFDSHIILERMCQMGITPKFPIFDGLTVVAFQAFHKSCKFLDFR